MSAARRDRWVPVAQVLGSVLVLVLLVRDADGERVLGALRGADLRWVGAAVAFKAGALLLHELRLWTALLPWTRAPLRPVLAIGFVSGLVNTALPLRGGDLVAMALLRAELGVPAGAAIAAVAITGFLEAALFGVFTLGVMLGGAAEWEALLGAALTRKATGTLTLAVLGAVLGATALVGVGRRLRVGGPPRPGPLALLRDSVVRTGEGLSAFGPVGVNLGLCAVQVLALVASFWALLPALGLDPPLAWLAASGVIAVGALTSVLLPPSLGAGPAAASVLVLGFFGVGEAEALGFAALSWLGNTLPPLVLGLGPLLGRLHHLGAILRGGGSPEPGRDGFL